MPKILLVEDDLDLADMLESWLSGEKYTVEVANDGAIGLELLRMSGFDVVVLDWDLPSMAGIDVLKEYRKGGGLAPIIMLTGKSEIADKESGLGTGADDYLTKPFAVRELSARIRALLRRPQGLQTTVFKSGNLELDASKHRVTVAGAEVHLLPRDFALLEFFMRHQDQVFSAEALISRVWSTDSDATPEGLRTAIKRIRKKIDVHEDETKSAIETIPRVGYRFRAV
ncbi:MAG: response regulator transcription factor [Candidatus Obscuribacterales bacterium]|nr:response regulator transcription factor [Candidatus Obscuribacterales bacterium]